MTVPRGANIEIFLPKDLGKLKPATAAKSEHLLLYEQKPYFNIGISNPSWENSPQYTLGTLADFLAGKSQPAACNYTEYLPGTWLP